MFFHYIGFIFYFEIIYLNISSFILRNTLQLVTSEHKKNTNMLNTLKKMSVSYFCLGPKKFGV